ncbi:hypothetical protein Lal_00032825 [Lupinus albus]|nr:hypothetical protein Lal_00032825 [Lupinus albus]
MKQIETLLVEHQVRDSAGGPSRFDEAILGSAGHPSKFDEAFRDSVGGPSRFDESVRDSTMMSKILGTSDMRSWKVRIETR